MGYFRLVWASLWRKKTRTSLTLLSLVSAFLLFGLLQAVGVFFTAGADFVGASRLIVQSRVSFTQSLPMRMLPEIESIPGVKAVNHDQWFGGVYGENRQMFTFASDPARLRQVYPEWVMTDAEWDAFEKTRTGAIVGRVLADQYGFKVGDKLPSGDTIKAIDAKTGKVSTGAKEYTLEYQFGSMAGTFAVQLDDVNKANEVARAIDARFLNSPNETKTQSEKDFNKGFFAQIGDIGLIVSLILMAVFFTILLLTGNTMAQAVRERIPELAVLKTLGFSDAQVTGLVLAESLFLCFVGGLIGMSFAALMITGLAQAAPGFFGAVRASGTVWVQALMAMLGLALAVGLPPALKAGRIRIVDALAGR